MDEDIKNLDLLAIFHYVLGGLTILVGFFPIIHVSLGIAMLCGVFEGDNDAPPAFVGLIFVMIGGMIMLLNWAQGVLIIIAGRKLKAKRSRTFCFVIACLECLMMPLGTILGVFTIILLSKDDVKELFESNSGSYKNDGMD